MSQVWSNGIGAVAILMLAVGQAAAQLPGQDERQGQQQGQQPRQQVGQSQQSSGQSGQVDKHLAKLLIAKNEAAIKLNEFAQQQAQDQQVKQFASQMVEAHQQLNQKLQKVAGQSRQSAGQQGDAAEKIVQLFDRVESQFAQKLIEGLRKKQGQQFDNTLIGLEVLGHMRMVETLDVMQQQASGELQQILQQAHKETQKHLQEAEQLSQKIEKSAVAQRPQPGQQQQQQQ
jgi:putative membrane protein